MRSLDLLELWCDLVSARRGYFYGNDKEGLYFCDPEENLSNPKDQRKTKRHLSDISEANTRAPCSHRQRGCPQGERATEGQCMTPTNNNPQHDPNIGAGVQKIDGNLTQILLRRCP